MKKRKTDNRTLIYLSALAVALLFTAILILYIDSSLKWHVELAKAIMSLAMTVIIGGLLKLLFDQHQERLQEVKEDEKNEEAARISEKEKEEEEKNKRKEFRIDSLNRLRKVFDDVDGARLLIEAHKSAKTYGEKIRENIIPSVVSLYDIKRSLVDSTGMLECEKLRHLRLNIHFMIAYLQALANEYKLEYLDISNTQYYEEELKKQIRDNFIKALVSNNQQSLPSSLPVTPSLSMKKIEDLPVMGKFIIDEYDTAYRKVFVDYYEYSKKILKEQSADEPNKKLFATYLEALDDLDLKKGMGPRSIKDSLVNRLIRDLKLQTP